MIDYHLHLWAHSDRAREATLEELANYCDKAQSQGVEEIAITEHFFRFKQATAALKNWWDEVEPDPALAKSMKDYWDFHATEDLDEYVEIASQAKSMGLPIVIGLEVDFYKDRMDKVSKVVNDYPFDVLLGSIHWLGTWRFDDIDDELSMSEWEKRDLDKVWTSYVEALEELADTKTCDVLAHPDLIKVTGRKLDNNELRSELNFRMANAAIKSGMAAELSSAGWRKPVQEQYPSTDLLDEFIKLGVPLTTASDAHKIVDVADRTSSMRKMLESRGVSTLAAFDKRLKREVPV